MRKALQRAAQALVAAGAFGVIYPAVAQTTLPAAKPVSGTLLHTGAPSSTHDAEANSPSQSKLEEMEIELALLANPSTFAYPLGVKSTGANVELHGFVPSKYVKEQALETARKHCTVPVIDKLQVNDAMMLRTGGGNADELKKDAAALLADGAGPMSGLDIKAAAAGHLTLNGSCESYEQKVEISKKLRGLNGCCAVDNCLAVKPVLREGRMVTLVSTDGSVSVPENDGGMPTHPLAHAESRTANNGYSWLDAPPVPPPAKAGATQKVAKMDLPPVPAPPAASGMRMETSAPLPHKADPVPAVAMKSDLPPLPPAPAELNKGMQTPPALPPAKPASPPVAQTTATFASAPAQSPSPYAHVPAYASAPVNGSESVKTMAAVEHLPPPPAPVKPVTPPTTGWPTAHDAHPTQVAYATTGVVLFDDDGLPEPPPLLANDQALLLKRKVAAVCGAKAKSVVVETRPDGLHVHVQSTARSEDEALTRQIYALPEMGQNVKLHIELGK